MLYSLCTIRLVCLIQMYKVIQVFVWDYPSIELYILLLWSSHPTTSMQFSAIFFIALTPTSSTHAHTQTHARRGVVVCEHANTFISSHTDIHIQYLKKYRYSFYGRQFENSEVMWCKTFSRRWDIVARVGNSEYIISCHVTLCTM